MDLELIGKKALISAGHKGIGLHIATRLLEEGAEVSFCCRKQSDLDSAVTKLSEVGTVRGYLCDFSDHEQVKAWVNEAGNAMSGIDICIGNASASSQHGEGPDPWKASFEVDLLGTAMFYGAGRDGIGANTLATPALCKLRYQIDRSGLGGAIARVDGDIVVLDGGDGRNLNDRGNR